MQNKTLLAYIARNDAVIAGRRQRMVLEAAAALVSLLLALLVFVLSDDWTLIDWAALAVGIAGVALAIDAWRLRTTFLLAAAPERDSIYESCEWPARKVEIAERYAPDIAEEKARILSVCPSTSESAAGFAQVFPGMGCEEPAFSCRALDDWLVGQPHIPIRRDQRTGLSTPLSRGQKSLLWARINADTETTDDEKLCLISDFHDVPVSEARVAMRTYFDSTVTNEAFRSRVFHKPVQAANRGELVADFAALKALPDGKTGPLMPQLGHTAAANHIGASVLIITADHLPVLFQQGIKQEEGAGRLVVSGTGSADWSDLTELPGENGLLDVARVTMFREFLEEGTIMTRPNSVRDTLRAAPYLPTKRLEMAQELSVIGFFRWVSRFGKPEFLGFGRTPLLASEIKADSKEVVTLTGRHDLRLEIRRMQDLVELRDKLVLREGERQMKLALSSAMVVHRLAEIASAPGSMAYQALASRHQLSG